MIARIVPAPLVGEIVAPPSKSYAHRILIAEFLSGMPLSDFGDADDVQRTKRALSAFREGGTADCGDSASTFRFLLPIAAVLGKRVRFVRSKALQKRPSEELIDLLNSHGAKIEQDTVFGKIDGGRYEITASVSSQYISGLLFALPLAKKASEIVLHGLPVSKPYTDMTIEVLRLFGIRIERRENGFFVPPHQTYRPVQKISFRGDYSAASCFLAGGAIGGDVTVRGLVRDGQGDAAIADALRLFGAKVDEGTDFVRVRKSELYGITLSCEDIPDLVSALSVAAAYAKGRSVFTGVSRLKNKESDRLAGIIESLESAGIFAKTEGDTLIVEGGKPKGAKFFGAGDHRRVMAAAMLAVYAEGESEITCAESVKKSYPAFFEAMQTLGGDVHVCVDGQ